MNFYVDTSRPDDTGDGLSWATAKKTFAGVAGVISVASPGDTINVAAGTYTEVATAISWTKNNLTILGPNAGIDPVTNLAGRGPEAIIKFEFYLNDVSVVLDGLKFEGVATMTHDACIRIAGVNVVITPVVRNCIFTGVCEQYCAYVAGTLAFPMQNGIFEQNLVTSWTNGAVPPTLRNSVWFARGDFSTFRGNLITNPPPTAIGPQLFGSSFSQVVDNTFEGFGSLAPCLNLNGSERVVDGFLVARNVFRNCQYAGIQLRVQTFSLSNVTITENLFEGNKTDVRLYPTPTPAPSPLHRFNNIHITNNTFRRDTDGAYDKVASVEILLQQPGAIGDIDVMDNVFEAYGTYSAGQKEFYGVSVEGNDLTTLTVTGNSFAGLKNTGVLVPDSSGVLFRSNSVTYGLLGISTIIMSRNSYAGFDNGIGIYNAVGAAYGALPAGVALAAHREMFDQALTYGVRSGTGALTDATECFWGAMNGPSGGVQDPVTGTYADGDGCLVSTYVRFAPWETTGVYIRPTQPESRPLSGPTSSDNSLPGGTQDSDSAQNTIERSIDEGSVPVFGDGKTRNVSKGAPGSGVPFAASAVSRTTLTRNNAGVVMNWSDKAGRFDNPGKV